MAEIGVVMTNQQLLDLICAFNDRTFPSFAALRSLSDTIVLGHVWTEVPTGQACDESSRKFYFIRDREKCVGIVYEMGKSDLHWLVLPEHRKKGHLHRALHEYVFPHMFSDGRETQLATANSRERADYAIRQGFEELSDPGPDGDILLRLDRSKVDVEKCPMGTDRPLNRDRVGDLKVRLRQAKAMVRSVSEEVLCSYGVDVLQLDELAERIEEAASEAALDLRDFEQHRRLPER